MRGRGGCGYVACWLILETSGGVSLSIGTAARDGPEPTFELRPHAGFGVIGLAREPNGTALRLIQRRCGLIDPPSPPGSPAPPSPPPHASANLLTLRDWQRSDDGGDGGWQYWLFEHGGVGAYLRASHQLCVATQTVDLLEPRAGYLGYPPDRLYAHGLAISVSVVVEAFDGYGGNPPRVIPDYFFVRFELQNAARGIIATWTAGGASALRPITPEQVPRELSHTFRPYQGHGYRPPPWRAPSWVLEDYPRFVIVEIGGKDVRA